MRIRRRTMAAALVTALGLTVLSATPAAACDGTPVFDSTGQIIDCITQSSGGQPGSGTPTGGQGGGSNWSPPPGHALATYRVQAYEDGEPCIREQQEWVPEEDLADVQTFRNTTWFRWYDRLTADGSTMEWCEEQGGEPALDPEMVRQMILNNVDLPDPAIDPGRSITGMRSYLQINGPTAWDDEIRGDVLPVTVVFQGRAEYRVDWGDGTVRTYASSGGPYPSGDVVHVYTSTGDYTVTVTPIWTVSWQGGGLSAEFSAELDSSTVDLPVGEMQSVRTD